MLLKIMICFSKMTEYILRIYSYSFHNEERNGTYLPRFSASDHPFIILKLFAKPN